jgi:hypothetical protein
MPVPPRAPLRPAHSLTRPASLTHPQPSHLTGLRPVTALDTSSLKNLGEKNPAEAGSGVAGTSHSVKFRGDLLGLGLGLTGGETRVIQGIHQE